MNVPQRYDSLHLRLPTGEMGTVFLLFLAFLLWLCYKDEREKIIKCFQVLERKQLLQESEDFEEKEM